MGTSFAFESEQTLSIYILLYICRQAYALELCHTSMYLTLKAPVTTAADNIYKYFLHCFSEKIRLDVTSESSARQRIHKKNQALFSLKDKSKN